METYDTLAGQTALVTGANRGIGRQIALNLAAMGATVYATVRGGGAPEHPNLRPIILDVRLPDTFGGLADIESLDMLVNNAGVGDWGNDLASMPMENLANVFATNIVGPMLLTQAYLPKLQDGARIVNLSSGMGAMGEGMSGGAPAYRVSKTAVNGFTTYLAGEYPQWISNCCCPGWVKTDMGGGNATREISHGADTPTWLATFMPGQPSGYFWRDRAIIDW